MYPKVNACELLDNLARLKGFVDARLRRETVDALLQRVNLYAVRKRKLGGDSGGMRQRLGIDGEALALRKELMHDGENRYTMIVHGEPFKAGIDPLDKLIDRDASDNLVEIRRLP